MTRNATLIHLSGTQSGHWGAFRDQTTPQEAFTALCGMAAGVKNAASLELLKLTCV